MDKEKYKCPNCGKEVALSDNNSCYIAIEDELFCSGKCLDEQGEKSFQNLKKQLKNEKE